MAVFFSSAAVQSALEVRHAPSLQADSGPLEKTSASRCRDGNCHLLVDLACRLADPESHLLGVHVEARARVHRAVSHVGDHVMVHPSVEDLGNYRVCDHVTHAVDLAHTVVGLLNGLL